jgi:2-polyprenyl-6-methoxyphenol hydroxylase-like FAD-dependent oxidoreductase
VTVYEQAQEFAPVGAGIQIGCNAMHVLRGTGYRLGLWLQRLDGAAQSPQLITPFHRGSTIAST